MWITFHSDSWGRVGRKPPGQEVEARRRPSALDSPMEWLSTKAEGLVRASREAKFVEDVGE